MIDNVIIKEVILEKEVIIDTVIEIRVEKIKEIIVKVPVERIVEIEVAIGIIRPVIVEKETIEYVDYNIYKEEY